MTNTNWDVRFVELAKHISTWSKDPSKQIGAVAVGNDRRILSTGYNGFPKGIADDPERYDDRSIKYELVVHAEMNCIYNAGLTGTSLKGSTMYVYGLPVCSECAKGIIQVGINRIVIEEKEYKEKIWIDSFLKTVNMFTEANIEIDYVRL